MQKRKKKLFKQLDDRNISKYSVPITRDYPRMIEPFGYSYFVFQDLPSDYPKDSLGYFADQLKKSPDSLIKQFAEAGVLCLTPFHRLTEGDKLMLLKYLKSKSFGQPLETECLYSRRDANGLKVEAYQSINEELLREIAKEPNSLYQLPSRKFEELVAKIFEDQGYSVLLTPERKDGGYDILCRSKDKWLDLLFLVECKKYAANRPVGVEIVRGLYGVTEMQKANFGMIVTTSSFTKGAHAEKLQMGSRMNLKEFNDLKNWLSVYQSI